MIIANAHLRIMFCFITATLLTVVFASSRNVTSRCQCIDSIDQCERTDFAKTFTSSGKELIKYLFLILETINDYLCEKIKAKTFVDVSKRIISLSQNYSRKNEKPDFNLMLSQNYEIVQAYFFETPLSIVFSIIEIICILIAVCFSFLPFGLLFLIAVPLGVFISTIGQNKINNLKKR